jgi:Holliday junction resolvase RusA-like endonuclease
MSAVDWRLVVVALGLPAPQGSKRHVGGGVMIESSKKVKPWREDVKHAALAAMDANPGWDRDAGLIYMHVVFTLPRPRSHYRTGKFDNLLRDGAPDYCAKKPDLDKLLRSTCDALTTAGAYVDDSRVVSVIARKSYITRSRNLVGVMDRPGARITLTAGASS